MCDYKSKKYVYNYSQYSDEGLTVSSMAKEILEDNEVANLEEIVIGCWGDPVEIGCQNILDMFVEHKEHFLHIKSLFLGDMEYDECEVSWIEQGNYSEIWKALPNLESLTIKGSNNLTLGAISHNTLKSLTIICGGLPVDVIKEITSADLPNLEILDLYIGVDNYGFDGEIKDIEPIFGTLQFPKLKSLSVGNSEIQDEIVACAMESVYLPQLNALGLANGTLTDLGGQLILNNIDKLSHLDYLDLHYNFLSNKMIGKLNKLPFKVNTDEQEKEDVYEDEIYRCAMLTE